MRPSVTARSSAKTDGVRWVSAVVRRSARRRSSSVPGKLYAIAAILLLSSPAAFAPCFNPIPNPQSARFTQEGSEPDVLPGNPLVVPDPSANPAVFLNFFCLAADEFTNSLGNPKEVVLNPRLSLEPGFVPHTNGNLGVHTTINDGSTEIRAVLRSVGTSQVEVVIVLSGNNFSSGFLFPGLDADYTLMRLTNGNARLSVTGQPPVLVSSNALPASQRPGEKTIEFGTYDVPAASETHWTTLDLPELSTTNVCPGEGAIMSVTLTNPGVFMWFCNGDLLPDQTNDTLVVTNLTKEQNGTIYSCIASNATEFKHKYFENVVVDTTPPVVTGPSDITVTAPDTNGAVVTFGGFFASDDCGILDSGTFQQSHFSGSLYPIGVTLVMASVADTCSNAGQYSFTITVLAPGGNGVVDLNYGDGHQIPVGDPVSGFSGGHFRTEAPDLNVGGPGAPIFFQRHYDSKLLDDGAANSALGPNWQHNYDLTLATNGTNATVVFREGRILRFGHDGTNWNLTGRTDVPFQLIESGPEFLLGDPRSQFMYFFGNGGLLLRIQDGRGNTNFLSHDGSRLTNVTDTLNRSLDFTYDAGGLLTNITDGIRAVSFHYTGGKLTSAADALGQVTFYAYDAANTNNPALMTTRTLPEGNTPITSVYDTQGRVIAQTDAVGNAVAMRYFTNAGNRINIFTNAVSDTQVQTYNPNGELSQFTDEAGNSLNMASDAAGRRNSATDRLGHTTQITYDNANGFPVQIDLPSNPDEFMAYSARGVGGVTFFDLSEAAHPDNTTNRFGYDVQGNLIFSTNRNSDVWSYGHNSRGQLLSTTNPLGGVATLTYDANARLASATDADIGVTTFAYDPLNRLTNITRPNPDTVELAYDALNRLTSVTDERANTTAFQYDANSRLTNVVNALGQASRFEYDDLNRLRRAVDRLGQGVTFGYDPRSLLTSVTNRNGFVTRFEFDERQRRTGFVNAGGATNRVQYDAEGRMTALINPLGETLTLQRDPMGYTTKITDPLGNSVALELDAVKRVTRFTDSLGRNTFYAYDPRGLITNVTRQAGITARYQYNALGLLTNLTDPILSPWAFGYSPMGRQTSLSDPLGRQTLHEYDVRGRVRRVTFADGTTLTNTYDGANNLTRLSYSDGTVFEFAYDPLNRLTNANASDPIALSYDAMDRVINTRQVGVDFGAAFDADGRLTNVTYNSGQMVATYVYDNRDRLIHVSDDLTGQGMGFSYDEADRLTGITRSNGVNTTYTHDAAGQLTRIQDGAIMDLQYTLDEAGQVRRASYLLAPIDPTTVMTNEAASFTYDAASQLNSAGYAYDPRGRLTNAPNTALQWDGASRLLGIGAVSLGYNAFDDLALRVEGGNTNRYFYNHALGRLPIVAERNDNTGQFVRFYVWSPDGRLLYLIHRPGNTMNYPHFDYTRSTLALTDSSGLVTDAYAYDPHGRILSQIGTNPQPFRFVGEYGVRHEPGGNLYQMRARYYDPHTARFVSKEPVWPAVRNPLKLNPYQYAQSDPVNLVDRAGTEDESPRPSWCVGCRFFEYTAGTKVESYYLSPELQAQANQIYEHLRFVRFTNVDKPFSAADAEKLEEEILDLFRRAFAGDLGLVHPLTMRYLYKPTSAEHKAAEELLRKLLIQADELKSYRESELQKRRANPSGDEHGFFFDGGLGGGVAVSFPFDSIPPTPKGQQGRTDGNSLLFTGDYGALRWQTTDPRSTVQPGLSLPIQNLTVEPVGPSGDFLGVEGDLR